MLPVLLGVKNTVTKQPENPEDQKPQEKPQQDFNPEKLNFQDLIRKKKNGESLSQKEIDFWIKGVTLKQLPDYQISALLMAIYFKGMNIVERSHLTRAMAHSGDFLKFDGLQKKKADKHSTGGVGDKTSFIISPLMVALDLVNPMISGRGLGHTGGTVDKLESIQGFSTSLTQEQMKTSIDKIGSFIIGQTADIAPADKVIYALRDVTQTVNEISLITASILSKKFAENLDILTLDVKYGSGAFMVKVEDSLSLAESLVNTANQGGVNCNAVITRMDYPLGEWSGNACEIYEALQALTPNSEYTQIVQDKIQFNSDKPGYIQLGTGQQPQSNKEILVFVTFGLLLNSVILAGNEPRIAFDRVKQVWVSGQALQKFQEMIKQQGGDLQKFEKDSSKILQNFQSPSTNKNIFQFKAPFNGKIKSLNGQKLGYILVDLGAGRRVKTDLVNPLVSMRFLVHPNQELQKGQVICEFYHPENPDIFDKIKIQELLEDAFEFTEDLEFQDQQPFIYQIVKPTQE